MEIKFMRNFDAIYLNMMILEMDFNFRCNIKNIVCSV